MTLTFTDADALAAGVYPAVLRAIEDGENDNGPYRRWTFDVLAPDGVTHELRAFSTTAGGPRSKAYKWATVLLGHKPPVGEPVDVTGKACRVVLNVNEDGYNRVGDLLPPESSGSNVNLRRLDEQVYADKSDVTPAPVTIGF
jgi:hypothetical protein